LKKLLMSLVLGTFMLVTTATTTSAASGWQLIGQHILDMDNRAGTWNYADWDLETKQQLGEVYTLDDGGSMGLRFVHDDFYQAHFSNLESPYGQFAVLEVMIYEDDGTSNPADYISTHKVFAGDILSDKIYEVDNLGQYADGENGKAEIDIRYTWNFDTLPYTHVYVYD
jgi:hypothetical protein